MMFLLLFLPEPGWHVSGAYMFQSLFLPILTEG